MEKIYYETIRFETMCKNGSVKLGIRAITNTSMSRDGKTLNIEISQLGKTKEEAEIKLLKFLTENSECVGSF